MPRRDAANLPSGWEHRGESDPVTSHGPGEIRQDRRTKDEAGTTVAPNRNDSGAARTDAVRHTGVIRRLTTETKQAFKTTEFWAMVGIIVAILVSAAAIKGGDTGGTDEFIARQAWLYVAIVAAPT